MGNRNPLRLEGANADGLQGFDLVQARPLLLGIELVADQSGGKRGGVERAVELLPQMRDGTNVVLVPVGDQQCRQLDVVLFQRGQAGHGHHVVATRCGRQCKAAIHRDPLAAGTEQGEVGAEHASAAQGQEKGSGLAMELIKGGAGHRVLRLTVTRSLAAPGKRRPERP